MRLLNTIVALLDSYTSLLKDFGFLYDDGKSVFYGIRASVKAISSVRPSVELPFAICGNQGERVIKISVAQESSIVFGREHIAALHVRNPQIPYLRQFFTLILSRLVFDEFRRRMLVHVSLTREGLCRDVCYLPVDTRKHPDWFHCGIDSMASEQSSHILSKATDNRFLQDHNAVPDYDSIFRGFEVIDSEKINTPQRIKPFNISPQTLPILSFHLEISPHISRQGGCFTSILLTDIRHIRFSVGTSGRLRTDQHLSGLRFEFYNSERDSIVDQWLEQVDYLDLPDDDSIALIRVWLRRRPTRRILSAITTERLWEWHFQHLRELERRFCCIAPKLCSATIIMPIP